MRRHSNIHGSRFPGIQERICQILFDAMCARPDMGYLTYGVSTNAITMAPVQNSKNNNTEISGHMSCQIVTLTPFLDPHTLHRSSATATM